MADDHRTVAARIPAERYEEVRVAAFDDRVTVSRYIDCLIRDDLKRRRRNAARRTTTTQENANHG